MFNIVRNKRRDEKLKTEGLGRKEITKYFSKRKCLVHFGIRKKYKIGAEGEFATFFNPA